MFGGFKGLFGGKGKDERASRPAAPKPAARVKPAARPKLKRINLQKRFTILAELGQGTMSRVYRALDNEHQRSVCLKVQDKAKTVAAVARTTSSTSSYRPTEGEIGVQINHPNIVRTFEYGATTKGEYYVVMEYIDGVSLNFVRESRGLALADKVELLAQAAEGLAAVHKAGFIHHDFGPKNLLVDRDNRLKLIDFGLTIPNTPEFRRPGNRTGTLQYLAPEVIRRETKDERLDIFSWGVTAFEMLAGRQPYDVAGDAMTQIRLRMNIDPLELAKVAPHLPAELCAIVQKTLARRKEDRWPKAATLATALRELELPAGR
jgi:serine/threonine protein kinase